MNKVHATLMVVVILASISHGQSYSVLYNFGSVTSDPRYPQDSGTIAQGRDGNLYSTAPWGGKNNQGAAFRITPSGALTTLVTFSGGSMGGRPFSGLTLGSDGNFYGAAYQGGPAHFGTLFRMTPAGHVTILHRFFGPDGANPLAPPIEGLDQNFYGTTFAGGNSTCSGGCGTIYKITPHGTFSTLIQFNSTDGSNPIAPLVQGTDGWFYGTTYAGGPLNAGVLFKVSRTGKLAILHYFGNDKNGASPASPLIEGTDGKFYGTALEGNGGFGVVFRTAASGGYAVLHTMNGTTDGYAPYAGLLLATDGNFYGAASRGGLSSNCGGALCGTLFSMAATGSYSVLYNFDGTTGEQPTVTPIQHTNGLIYGDTSYGGVGTLSECTNNTCGVFYSLNGNLSSFITLLPYAGKAGKTIEFLGQGFTGTSGVLFNGVPASFIVKSDTYLTAIVPNDADTGFVTVTTPNGVLNSNRQFRVLQ